MARVVHTPRAMAAAHPTLQPAADSLDLAWVAADTTNKEQVAFTGREILLAWNTDAGAQTVTIDGVVLSGRSGSVTAYSIGADEIAIIWLPIEGWRQSDGNLYFEAASALVKFAVLKIQ